MTEPDLSRLRALFDGALAQPASERKAWLDRACPSEPALVRRVLRMLAAAEDDRFLGAPTDTPVRPEAAVVREAPGTSIGPYKLLQQIGEGGCGVVFLAEQSQPVSRKVALKIVKLGMDTAQVIARFEQERQALALMDHPHIARVIDAGATATGRPYFVMELVKGQPIGEYCDREQLTIDQRLELFAQICLAVQHAHSKGIIHRDIKPSNVLVGTVDGRPHAKVIDFGIAKAAEQKLTERTLFTEHHQVIGTLQYMSPEQAAGALDIDTRTDVYSLGVLLYELLTGSTPFDRRMIQGALFGELQRMIREVEPPRPSTRLTESQELLASIAAQRRVEPKRLGVLVRGDLDWIVMKALDKDRARRYATAVEFAADVARHLAGEPVVAAPPGARYRLRKFARRHRGKVLAGSALALSMIVGTVGFAWQSHVARKERDRAMHAEGESLSRAEELERVVDFQAGMLRRVDPARAGQLLVGDVVAKLTAALARGDLGAEEQATQVTAFRELWRNVNPTDAARELIDATILRPAVASIAEQFAEQPLVAARLKQTLARRYQDIGLPAAALPLIRGAADSRRRLLGDDHDDTLSSLAVLASIELDLGNLEASEQLSAEVLEAHRRRHGDDDPKTLRALNDRCNLLLALGRPSEAEPVLRDLVERSRLALGNEDEDTLSALLNLGGVLSGSGRFAEAEPLVREAVAGRRALHGADDPATLSALNYLALLLGDDDRLAEAETLLREVLAGRRRVLGEDHPDTLVSLNNLGMLSRDLRRWDDAEALFREAIERRERVFGRGHVETLVPRNNLGLLLNTQERYAEAEPVLRDVAAERSRLLGAEHRETLTAQHNLGMALSGLGRLDEAEALTRRVLATRRRVLGDDHVHTISTLNSLATTLRKAERAAEAEPVAREVVERMRRLSGDDHPYTLIALVNLGSVLDALGRLDEAEAQFRAALTGQAATRGEDDAGALNTVSMLAELVARRGRHAEAVALLEPRLSGARQVFTGPSTGALGRVLVTLGAARARLAQSSDEYAVAASMLREAHELQRARTDTPTKHRRACAQALTDLYTAWAAAAPNAGHEAAAEEWRQTLARIETQ